MGFRKTNTIYIVQINYKTTSDIKHVSRYRYNSCEKAESAVQYFKKELEEYIDCITIIKEKIDIL